MTEENYFAFGVTIAVLFAGLLLHRSSPAYFFTPHREALLIKNEQSLARQIELLNTLLSKIGPERAQDELAVLGLPNTGSTHLLIHSVGDYIYQRFGARGIVKCRDYFFSACYHGVIIHVLAGGGMTSAADMMAECWSRGFRVNISCSHAMGHGFLAWVDYDIPKSLDLCDVIGQQSKEFAFVGCYEGVFMENAFGLHNGGPSPRRWINTADSSYPCNDQRIQEKYRIGCWMNQASILGSLQRNTSEIIVVCEKAPAKEYREKCVNNLVRNYHSLTLSKPHEMVRLCKQLPDSWYQFCLISMLDSEFNVGGFRAPLELCEIVANSGWRDRCYHEIVSRVPYYFSTQPFKKNWICAKIPNLSDRKRCRENQPVAKVQA